MQYFNGRIQYLNSVINVYSLLFYTKNDTEHLRVHLFQGKFYDLCILLLTKNNLIYY
jgi:hypothetical protein